MVFPEDAAERRARPPQPDARPVPVPVDPTLVAPIAEQHMVDVQPASQPAALVWRHRISKWQIGDSLENQRQCCVMLLKKSFEHKIARRSQ